MSHLTGQSKHEDKHAGCTRCPYHDPILNLDPRPASSDPQIAIERFLADKGPQEGAVLFDPKEGKLSIGKDCRCRERLQELNHILLMKNKADKAKPAVQSTTHPMTTTSQVDGLFTGIGAVHGQPDDGSNAL